MKIAIVTAAALLVGATSAQAEEKWFNAGKGCAHVSHLGPQVKTPNDFLAVLRGVYPASRLNPETPYVPGKPEQLVQILSPIGVASLVNDELLCHFLLLEVKKNR